MQNRNKCKWSAENIDLIPVTTRNLQRVDSSTALWTKAVATIVSTDSGGL